MALKAKLSVRLYAGEVLVAESENDSLWQKILTHLSAGEHSEPIDLEVESLEKSQPQVPKGKSNQAGSPQASGGGAESQLARELGVGVQELMGALNPTATTPFLHLDHHCWEAFKKNTPSRGNGSISPVALAGTLLALWCRAAKIDGPSLTQVQAVLTTISLTDKNPNRGVTNCRWLHYREKKVFINPAEFSSALGVARAFCQKKPIQNGAES